MDKNYAANEQGATGAAGIELERTVNRRFLRRATSPLLASVIQLVRRSRTAYRHDVGTRFAKPHRVDLLVLVRLTGIGDSL